MRRVCGAWKCAAGGDGSYNEQCMLRYYHKVKNRVLSEWANAKSKKPQKTLEILMWYFAPTISFFMDYVMHNIHFFNGAANLHHCRKSSK
jgi:hypothetical protein